MNMSFSHLHARNRCGGFCFVFVMKNQMLHNGTDTATWNHVHLYILDWYLYIVNTKALGGREPLPRRSNWSLLRNLHLLTDFPADSNQLVQVHGSSLVNKNKPTKPSRGKTTGHWQHFMFSQTIYQQNKTDKLLKKTTKQFRPHHISIHTYLQLFSYFFDVVEDFLHVLFVLFDHCLDHNWIAT